MIRLFGCAGMEVLGIRDGALAAGAPRLPRRSAERLLAERPGLVLVPSPLEVSEDHRAAFAALFDVLSIGAGRRRARDGGGAGSKSGSTR